MFKRESTRCADVVGQYEWCREEVRATEVAMYSRGAGCTTVLYRTARTPDAMIVKQSTECFVLRFAGCRSLATTSSRGATPFVGNPGPRAPKPPWYGFLEAEAMPVWSRLVYSCLSSGTAAKVVLIVILLMVRQRDVRSTELY